MTFEMARPHYTLPLAGNDYQLLGTFALIEAVELVMKDYIGNVAVRVVNGMPSHEAAKLLSVILTASGHPVTVDAAKELTWRDGVANQVTRMHLYSFLKICLAPPGQREAVGGEMGELMGSLKASLGETTSDSVSASSAGARTSSGKAPSGKSARLTKAGR